MSVDFTAGKTFRLNFEAIRNLQNVCNIPEEQPQRIPSIGGPKVPQETQQETQQDINGSNIDKDLKEQINAMKTYFTNGNSDLKVKENFINTLKSITSRYDDVDAKNVQYKSDNDGKYLVYKRNGNYIKDYIDENGNLIKTVKYNASRLKGSQEEKVYTWQDGKLAGYEKKDKNGKSVRKVTYSYVSDGKGGEKRVKSDDLNKNGTSTNTYVSDGKGGEKRVKSEDVNKNNKNRTNEYIELPSLEENSNGSTSYIAIFDRNTQVNDGRKKVKSKDSNEENISILADKDNVIIHTNKDDSLPSLEENYAISNDTNICNYDENGNKISEMLVENGVQIFCLYNSDGEQVRFKIPNLLTFKDIQNSILNDISKLKSSTCFEFENSISDSDPGLIGRSALKSGDLSSIVPFTIRELFLQKAIKEGYFTKFDLDTARKYYDEYSNKKLSDTSLEQALHRIVMKENYGTDPNYNCNTYGDEDAFNWGGQTWIGPHGDAAVEAALYASGYESGQTYVTRALIAAGIYDNTDINDIIKRVEDYNGDQSLVDYANSLINDKLGSK